MKAITMTAIVNPQVFPDKRISISQFGVLEWMDSPVFSKPRSVERPENVKYWRLSARVTI